MAASLISSAAPDESALPLRLGSMTSIGALPHRDPRHAAELVLDLQRDLPAMPSLPNRSPREGLIQQALWGIQGVSIDADGAINVDVDRIDPEAPLVDLGFDGDAYVGFKVFLDTAAGRIDPVKFQIAGPVTTGVALTMFGVPDEIAFAVAKRAVDERAKALYTWVASALPDAPLVAFLNEPALVGTAERDFPLSTDSIIDLVSGVLATWEGHAVTGVHCCGEADWKAILEAGPQVLSLPVGAQVDRSIGAVSSFLEAGGWIAWGAVPTVAPVGQHAGLYWKTLSAQWCELVQKGADPVLIRRRSLITPHCGLGEHEIDQAEHVLRLCAKVAASLQEQAVSVKLSVGA